MVHERDAQRRAEIIARDIATAKAKRQVRVPNDGSRIVFGSAGVNAIVDAVPNDQGPAGDFMVRIRYVKHGTEEEAGPPTFARGRPGDLNVPSDGDIVFWASPQLGD